MSLQTWQETLVSQTAAGTLFNTYTTAKTVINAQALVTVPAGYFQIGRVLRITVSGGISNRVSGPDQTTMQVMLGSIVVFTTGAMNLTTTAHTTIPFWAQFLLTCRAVGSGTAANFMGQAVVQGQMFSSASAQADSNASHGTILAPNTAPAVGTGFDSTIANTIDFWVSQSVSNAGNGIQVQQYAVESLN
jgi:hypothetical protein